MLPTKAFTSLPEMSFQVSIRSASVEIGVSESVECSWCQRRREKLSTTDTSWPRAEKRIAVGQPRYPSPPRIRIRMLRRRVADARAGHPGDVDHPGRERPVV